MTPGKTPLISLVGAGPGDPELLTIKAVRVLKSADVVLYDALVSKDILSLIPSDVPAWSVGKRLGAHSFRQEDINTLLVDFANKYGHVVRLKGGDPFVFGRGHEEVEFALARGIEVRVVPGVTSATAVPASLSIPLTRRQISESFWVITGTTREGKISDDLKLAVQSSATLVILMGLNKIEEIMQLLLDLDKAEIPVAVISNGTLPDQRHVIGTVATIVNEVAKGEIEAPAVIVIGEVVKLASVSQLQSIVQDQDVFLTGSK